MHIFSKVSEYRIDFDETECKYFMIKEGKAFDIYINENFRTYI